MEELMCLGLFMYFFKYRYEKETKEKVNNSK